MAGDCHAPGTRAGGSRLPAGGGKAVAEAGRGGVQLPGKGPPQRLVAAESAQLCHERHGVALEDEGAGRIDADPFEPACRRRARLGLEHPVQVAHAHPGGRCHRGGGVFVGGIGQDRIHQGPQRPVVRRRGAQRRRELGLAAGAVHEHHQLAGRFPGCPDAEVILDHGEGQVDARADARRGQVAAVADMDDVWFDRDAVDAVPPGCARGANGSWPAGHRGSPAPPGRMPRCTPRRPAARRRQGRPRLPAGPAARGIREGCPSGDQQRVHLPGIGGSERPASSSPEEETTDPPAGEMNTTVVVLPRRVGEIEHLCGPAGIEHGHAVEDHQADSDAHVRNRGKVGKKDMSPA